MKRIPVWLLLVAFIAVLALAAGILSVVPANKVALSPHAPINLDKRIRIDGQITEPIHGRLAFVGVEEKTVSVLQSWLLHFDKRVSQLPEVGNPGSSASVAQDKGEIVQSKSVAAEVAFQLAGQPATLTGDGAIVTAIDNTGPSAQLLKLNDTIVQVNGTKVQTARDVTDIIGVLKPGSVVSLGVRRNQRPAVVKLRTAAPVKGDTLHRSRIGIGVDTSNLKITLPKPVTIATGNVGGPSAGLAFALALYDSLSGTDLLGGRYVVATGELSLDGEVLPIGGVRQKAISAQDAGFDLMFVPMGQNETDAVAAVKQFCKSGGSKPCLHVIGVSSAQQAVAYLREDPSQLAALYGR